MYQIGFTSTFKKQFQRYQGIAKVQTEFAQIMQYCVQGTQIPTKYKNHKLQGNLKGYKELHVSPDVLVIYEVDDIQKKITFSQIGSHSNLFK